MTHWLRAPLLCRKPRVSHFVYARHFNVLAIESSADDTCAAIVDSAKKIHANVVIKQHNIHEEYGGIYPMSAIGCHQQNMPYAIRQALAQSGMNIVHDIDGIAFTRGPGMPGCLSVGMNAAKSLASALDKPLVGVHHMQGHALISILTADREEPKYPFISLLISGGHTLLLLATSANSFQTLATTRDESIGRSFDKVSKLLELKWTDLGPGDALEKFCEEAPEIKCPIIPPFPSPLVGQLAFSFSAFHSHAKALISEQKQHGDLQLSTKKAIARAFQTGVVAHLEEKLILGLAWCKERNISVRDIVVSGGVASNMFLRRRLQGCLIECYRDVTYNLVFPPPDLCTDNAVMIAWASMHRFLTNDTDPYSIELRPKWNIEEL
ncbi:tRNA N6-adenosine threonylcarbamoyltransferase [Psilocybe cubensis]|uniref:N(6)-L-threonylcarbamoyladenine synthase n=2 Tax=Psilocybe cubensis TaxID=181762 RepID=A0A8H7Y4K2_PSICU|nr:tRNA N6-adenosine threonylcarbamoyltransferase [Psilocybe cubensis]KAH9485285.1 tRNA N6-adenosine threonylcarbamoyltransferase [Psilocybe cubensis]